MAIEQDWWRNKLAEDIYATLRLKEQTLPPFQVWWRWKHKNHVKCEVAQTILPNLMILGKGRAGRVYNLLHGTLTDFYTNIIFL